MNALKRRWKLVSLAALAVCRGGAARRRRRPLAAVRPRSRSRVLSDCQGAFGSFDNQDLAGVVTAMAQFAGGHAKNRNKPRDGWAGGSINGHPLVLVGIGCSNDRADTAIKETKRLMEQLKADIMIGPLSGDESIAVANYAKQHPKKTFVDGAAGAQDTTLKVRAPNFFRFNGDGAHVERRSRRSRVQQARLAKTAAVVADDYQLRVDVCGGLHRRVLRGRRQRDQAGLPAAEHDGLLVVCTADADERRRHVRRRRRCRSDPVPEGLRAGARADRRARSSSATCSGARRGSSSSCRPASPARTSAAPARPATSQRRPPRPTTRRSGRRSTRSRRSAQPHRRRRRRSRTATTSTPGA